MIDGERDAGEQAMRLLPFPEIDIMRVPPEDVETALAWARERARRCFNAAHAEQALNPGSLLAESLFEQGWGYVGLAELL